MKESKFLERVDKQLKETFLNSINRRDAQMVLALIMKVRRARPYVSRIPIILVIFVFFILFYFLGFWPIALGFLAVAFILNLFDSKERRNEREQRPIREIEANEARAKLEEIMEFQHVQFPYWKGIAEKLKKILVEFGKFEKEMLPSHVLDGRH